MDASADAHGEEADFKCRQCEVEEKVEKLMVAQSELLMRITELETAFATDLEKNEGYRRKAQVRREGTSEGEQRSGRPRTVGLRQPERLRRKSKQVRKKKQVHPVKWSQDPA